MSQFFLERVLLEEELCQFADFLGHFDTHNFAATLDLRNGVA